MARFGTATIAAGSGRFDRFPRTRPSLARTLFEVKDLTLSRSFRTTLLFNVLRTLALTRFVSVDANDSAAESTCVRALVFEYCVINEYAFEC